MITPVYFLFQNMAKPELLNKLNLKKQTKMKNNLVTHH